MTESELSALQSAIRARIPHAHDGGRNRGDEIAEVASVIAAQFQPTRIVLFGSRASQRADEESDADLMVVMESPTSPLDQAVAITRAVPHRIALDILVRTPDQIAAGLAEGDSFITDVLTEGVTLFEASDAGVGRASGG